MLGIIICGHGGFASGMEQAMIQLIGPQPDVIAIDFPSHSGSDRLNSQCQMALTRLAHCDGIIFLTDLLGGTPFRVASTLALARSQCEVLTGVNLQLFVEMLLERNGLSAQAFRVQALMCGRRGLTSLADELAQQQNNPSQREENEGI